MSVQWLSDNAIATMTKTERTVINLCSRQNEGNHSPESMHVWLQSRSNMRYSAGKAL